MELIATLSDLPNQEVLTTITLIIASVSMVLSSLALLPHLRPGAAMLRDAILWAALVVVFVSMVGLGWRYWSEHVPQHDLSQSPPASVPAAAPTVAHAGY